LPGLVAIDHRCHDKASSGVIIKASAEYEPGALEPD
jgi:hypothetical protein